MLNSGVHQGSCLRVCEGGFPTAIERWAERLGNDFAPWAKVMLSLSNVSDHRCWRHCTSPFASRCCLVRQPDGFEMRPRAQMRLPQGVTL